MYPGPSDPDLGIFVANLERELLGRGHEIERAAVDRRGGSRLRHLALARDARSAARRFRPDVAYAHFLVPAGLAAALATRAPLVVTAHGQDVANVGTAPGARAATSYVVRRAAAVVAVSHWLRERLEDAIPDAVGKIEVVDCGVDLDRFRPRDPDEARRGSASRPTARSSSASAASPSARTCCASPAPSRATGRAGSSSSATARCVPLSSAATRIRLAGPRRPRLRSRRGSLPATSSASRACQSRSGSPLSKRWPRPARSWRRRSADPRSSSRRRPASSSTRTDDDELTRALARAAALPRPNLAGREAAGAHDVKRQAERVEEILLRAAAGRRA